MKNSQLFPFERNHYYAGKMLTSADFTAEQLYMNNKRRFVNNMMFGSGIVCGLGIVNLDDLSVLVESGVAIDSAGREIVVDRAVVKSLSSIEGFDRLTGEDVTLCLRYKEERVHPVYSVEAQKNGKEYECNRIDEGYELFLTDSVEDEAPSAKQKSGFILEEQFIENEDYFVKVLMPSSVPKGKSFRISFVVKRKAQGAKKIAIRAVFQLPAFYVEEDEHELVADFAVYLSEKGEQTERDFWVNARHTDLKETSIIAKREDIHIQIGDYEVEPVKDISFKVSLVDASLEDLMREEIGRVNLEMHQAMAGTDIVKLAELKLIRTETTYLIGNIREQGVKQYILTPSESENRSKYLSYFRNIPERTAMYQIPREERERGEVLGQEPGAAFMASGRIEIPLHVNMKKGDICYSDEIMHGLGKGNVYVDVGVEYMEDDPHFNNSVRSSVYGDTELFPDNEYMSVRTAVKVFNDKGSFQVAVKLMGEQRSIVLQVNWVAIKFATAQERIELQENKDSRIAPEMPTIKLKAKESHFVNVQFRNMQPCRLSYELTEPGSGEISGDGVYTAPSKEGVYEIYIYCTDMPKISTYVYAIVSK